MAPTYILPQTTTVPSQRMLFRIVRWACILWMIVLASVALRALPAYYDGVAARFCVPIEVALEAAQITLSACNTYMALLGYGIVAFTFVTSAFIFWKRPTQWDGLIGACTPLAYICTVIRFTYDLGSAQPEFVDGLWLLQIVNISLTLLGLFTLPTGRFIPAWSKWIIIAYAVMFILATYDQRLTALDAVNLSMPINRILGALWGVGLIAQIYRFRRFSTPQQRQQTKLMVFGAVFAFLANGFVFVVLTDVLQTSLGNTPNNGLAVIAYFLVVTNRLLLIAIIPISFAVAILRYRLWDIDLFINRTLVVAALTVILGLFFIGLLVVVQQGALLLTGGDQSNLAIAIAALGVALLFNPIRTRLQTYIDRRFYPQHLARIEAIASIAPPKFDTRTRQEMLNQEAMRLQQATTKTFGGYRLLEAIGAGGMAEVYRAEHIATTKIVALKTLLKNRLDGDSNLARFNREIQVIKQLQHPNIVQLYDYGKLGDTYYMAMEYIPGVDLARYLSQAKRLTLAQALPILREIAAALDFAHAQHFVHRDVKPSNVLLDPNPIQEGAQFRAVLADFGIAKVLTEQSLTQGGSVIGTLDYIAPEQILGRQSIDHRADIYALGALTYQMLTGELPFKAQSVGALLMAHLQSPAPDPRHLASDLPDQAARAILRALEKEQDSRPKSAGTFVQMLG
ncbi:MAG: serine/threonine protein kinase [Chloroflexi bacterium CFX4]|nr:serine/threonine protein kinase [Chloroflexi bacterium CFX4]MDL1923909.1 serine/threonine protein kinase [Chloroflexi bacterium CFX3]